MEIPWNSCWKILEFLLEICWMIYCKLTGVSCNGVGRIFSQGNFAQNTI